MRSTMEEDVKLQTNEMPAAAPSQALAPAPATPAMDVVVPPVAQDASPVAVATEPGAETPAAAQSDASAPITVNAKAQKPGPKPAKTHTAPVIAITLAVLAFIVLAGLAYYAYRKG